MFKIPEMKKHFYIFYYCMYCFRNFKTKKKICSKFASYIFCLFFFLFNSICCLFCFKMYVVNWIYRFYCFHPSLTFSSFFFIIFSRMMIHFFELVEKCIRFKRVDIQSNSQIRKMQKKKLKISFYIYVFFCQ